MIIDYERLGAFTIHDFCKLYGLGRSKAYQILNAGQIHARKAGKITLIDKASAERLVSFPPCRPLGNVVVTRSVWRADRFGRDDTQRRYPLGRYLHSLLIESSVIY